MKRALASLLVALATLLAFEGAVTAFAGTSLLRRWPWLDAHLAHGSDPTLLGITEEQRLAAAARNPGVLAAHPDPRVGWTLRPRSHLAILDGRLVSDADGLRKRPAPPAPDNAFRIALLGGSIPFGFGVDDTETLGHQLEQMLVGVRGIGARPLVCFTVAMPRWTTLNTSRYLLDHWDTLHPDLVLWMPFSNDLSDTDVIDETGRRRVWPDPASDDPWLMVSSDVTNLLYQRMKQDIQKGESPIDIAQAGPMALTADLSPESSRRYDRNVAAIAGLSEFLHARDVPLVLLQYVESPHAWNLRSRLAAAGASLPVVPLFKEVPAEFTLGIDPHPSADTQHAMAILVARALLEQGFVEGLGPGVPLPDLPAAYAERLAPPRTEEECLTEANRWRRQARKQLRSTIDLRTGQGIRQVYGGLDPTGLVGPALLVLLAPVGNRIALELEPLPERPDLYPLDVEVQADGVSLGHVRLEADGVASATFDLPPRSNAARPIEVKLIAEDWVVVRRDGHRVLAAFRPLRIASEQAP